MFNVMKMFTRVKPSTVIASMDYFESLKKEVENLRVEVASDHDRIKALENKLSIRESGMEKLLDPKAKVKPIVVRKEKKEDGRSLWWVTATKAQKEARIAKITAWRYGCKIS